MTLISWLFVTKNTLFYTLNPIRIVTILSLVNCLISLILVPGRKDNITRVTTKPNYFMSRPSLVTGLTVALIGCCIQAVFFKFFLKICLAFSTENFTPALKTQCLSSLTCVSLCTIHPGKENLRKTNFFYF